METEITTQLASTITSLAVNHPWILTALAVVGGARIVFKPLMSLIHAYTEATPSTKDDEWLKKAEASKAFKTVCWLIDLLASVKVGTQKK